MSSISCVAFPTTSFQIVFLYRVLFKLSAKIKERRLILLQPLAEK